MNAETGVRLWPVPETGGGPDRPPSDQQRCLAWVV